MSSTICFDDDLLERELFASGGPPKLREPELVILTLLVDRGGWNYGLDLVEASSGRLMRGVIYVQLMRMQDKGLVESRLEDHASLMASEPRRVYKVTKSGCLALEANR